MPDEPLWLTAEDVKEINEFEVSETGEPFHLTNKALLESACARPINMWAYENQEDIVLLAVTLLYGIAKNHAFEQGNKRTGLTAALSFIEANGYYWIKEDDEDLGHWVTELVTDQITVSDLAARIRPYVQPDPILDPNVA